MHTTRDNSDQLRSQTRPSQRPTLFITPATLPAIRSLRASSLSSIKPYQPYRGRTNAPHHAARAARRTRATAADVGSDQTDVSAPPQERAVLDSLLRPSDKQRYIFFGGKGGVGKTSTSAAVGLKCAQCGLRTLIISTDPAHSLGDALQVDLSDGTVQAVGGDAPLYAVETDPREAVDKFRALLDGLRDVEEDGSTTNQQDKPGDNDGWNGLLSKFGINEFSEILQTIPPGADELIALTAVLDLVNGKGDSDSDSDSESMLFDRIIIDTAPTGHTLRLLSFPDFLDSFLLQALQLRQRLSRQGGLVGTVVNSMLSKKREAALEAAGEKVSAYRDKMVELSDLFRDPASSEFVVVTIATQLAVAETRRLVAKLTDEGICVRTVVANQLLPADMEDAAVTAYVDRVQTGQAAQLSYVESELAPAHGLSVSTVARFDMEVRGVIALGVLSKVAFPTNRWPLYGALFEQQQLKKTQDVEQQFVFVGGKGGVGKTSISSSMALALAAQGFKTLILSTDPAHSLGDALAVDLSGGEPVRIEADPLVPGADDLYALEVDADRAVAEFQDIVDAYLAGDGYGSDVVRNLGLEQFAALLSNAPPGIDELVALTRVVELARSGGFDRVVVDTAPTGHTLRLLAFPDFLEGLLEKVARVKARIDGLLNTFRNLGGRSDKDNDADKAGERGLQAFRQNMAKLKHLITNAEETQFVVVTAPTALAVAESERLVSNLEKDGVAVRNIIVNQVIPNGAARRYVQTVVKQQAARVAELRDVNGAADKPVDVVEVPYFDVEVRGVYGLQALGHPMFSTDACAGD